MSTSSRSAERFKYGICLNDECSLCKEKKVQQIPMRKDLLCAECGKPLRECPPPKKGTDFKKIGIIAAAIAVLGAGGFGISQFVGGSEEPVQDTTIVATDSIAQEQPIVEKPQKEETVAKPQKEEPAQKPVKQEPQGKDLGYATYKGEMQNGQPHGTGTLTFKSSHEIDSRDSKGRVAEPGDYVSGLFYQGHVETAKWYGADGSLKGSLLLGRP